MQISDRIENLFHRLEVFGFDRRYVRQVALPEWWTPGMGQTPGGFTQTLILLSRSLGLSMESLLEDSDVVPEGCEPVKFLRRVGMTEEQLRPAQAVAAAAARIALYAMPPLFDSAPDSGIAAREVILRGTPGPVDLLLLLDYCWAIGIPVLHVGRFPAAARKMDALAMRHEGRPAIVLCRNTQFHAWILFHLAHELGHICKGHVGPEGVVVDEKVDMDDCFLREEWEANQFAVELLTGGDNCAFEFPLRTTGIRLAQIARAVGETNAVAPGFVALTHGHRTQRWPVAQAAVSLLEPSPNAIDLIRDRMRKHLDLERLPDDDWTFLQRVSAGSAEKSLSSWTRTL